MPCWFSFLSQASRSAATSSGISSGCICPIAARARDLLGRHRAVIIDDIGADREDDLRTIGEVFGRRDFDSTVVDHGTNGGHCCCSFGPWTTRPARLPNSAPTRESNRVIKKVLASGFPSFCQPEFPQMLVDLSPRFPQLGFQPLDPALHRCNIDFLPDRGAETGFTSSTAVALLILRSCGSKALLVCWSSKRST
jgi:hypothetical protein